MNNKEVKYYKLNSTVYSIIYRECNGEWQVYNDYNKRWQYTPAGRHYRDRLLEITLTEAFKRLL